MRGTLYMLFKNGFVGQRNHVFRSGFATGDVPCYGARQAKNVGYGKSGGGAVMLPYNHRFP